MRLSKLSLYFNMNMKNSFADNLQWRFVFDFLTEMFLTENISYQPIDFAWVINEATLHQLSAVVQRNFLLTKTNQRDTNWPCGYQYNTRWDKHFIFSHMYVCIKPIHWYHKASHRNCIECHFVERVSSNNY